MKPLKFTEEHLTRRPPRGLDVETTLRHFAIITYMVDPEALCPHVHQRFELDCIQLADGSPRALISVVPFLDQDFRFVNCPWPKWKFGQTNYRAYVTDSETGEHLAWFFGTSLASITVHMPRLMWKLPWHPARIHFRTEYNSDQRCYDRYEMTTTSRWAPAEVKLTDSGQRPTDLIGFPDLETAEVLLTHPLKGFFFRRDGRLGGYSIWHDRLNLTAGEAHQAEFPLLDRLGLVDTGDLSAIHSVLIQPATEFTIYLPPRKVRTSRHAPRP